MSLSTKAHGSYQGCFMLFHGLLPLCPVPQTRLQQCAEYLCSQNPCKFSTHLDKFLGVWSLDFWGRVFKFCKKLPKPSSSQPASFCTPTSRAWSVLLPITSAAAVGAGLLGSLGSGVGFHSDGHEVTFNYSHPSHVSRGNSGKLTTKMLPMVMAGRDFSNSLFVLACLCIHNSIYLFFIYFSIVFIVHLVVKGCFLLFGLWQFEPGVLEFCSF